MTALRDISIANQHPRLRIDRRAIIRAIKILDAHADRFDAGSAHAKTPNQKSEIPPGCPPGELSIVFLTDPALAQLHADFLDDPSPTDVITFEGDPALGQAGEICISVDRAADYAREHRRDFSTELTLYLVHGWLHLAGYDDLQPVKKRRMRAAEARALKLLAEAGVSPAFVLRK